MTPAERASLAEQLLSNPLFAEVMDGLERNATEAMIWAADDDIRRREAFRVQAIRAFRQDCEAALRNTQAAKGAVA
jgi:hypothetical protein